MVSKPFLTHDTLASPFVDSGHMSSISNSHLHATAWYLWDDAAQDGTAGLRGFRAICLSSPDTGMDPYRPWPTVPASAPSGSGVRDP
jgi:hypothetical protein